MNGLIDNLCRQNQEYIIEDEQLRSQLRTESKKLFLDSFKAYHKKYAHKNFTQHPEKYLRYDPSMLESMVDSFFGQ